MNLIEDFSNSIMYIIIVLGIIGLAMPLIMGLIIIIRDLWWRFKDGE